MVTRWAEPGMQVVCVDARPAGGSPAHPVDLRTGAIYTVAKVGWHVGAKPSGLCAPVCFLVLIEVRNPHNPKRGADGEGFDVERFRPLDSEELEARLFRARNKSAPRGGRRHKVREVERIR